MTLNPSAFLSIRDLGPREKGGRTARNGFLYQDHVGARFCLKMLQDESLTEIWFETHDDLVLHWTRDGEYVVEFVQVKYGDSISWTPNKLTERSQGAAGSSMLEKSLDSAKCHERTTFRIITSRDVSDELRVLKIPRGHLTRDRDGHLAALKTQVNARLPGVASQNGTTSEQWLEACLWEKLEADDHAVSAINRHTMDSIAHDRNQLLFHDHRDELYQKLLALVRLASTTDLTIEPDTEKLSRSALISWWDNAIEGLTVVHPGSDKLLQKFAEARIADDFADDAKALQWGYLSKKLTRDFISRQTYAHAEQEVRSALSYEKAQLDAGLLEDNGARFHLRCMDVIRAIAARPEYKALGITDGLLRGYMYELTSRCPHRFRSVTP
jgi:Cap4 dsDNA endonuclease